jgi:hypothetical protein
MHLPALDLIFEEVSKEFESRDAAMKSFDTRAGTVLAFSAALAAFAPGDQAIGSSLGRVVAIAAAGLAVYSLLPRKFPALKPDEARVYLSLQRDEALLRLLDTKIAMANEAAGIIKRKAQRLKYAIIATGAAVLLLASGAWAGETGKEHRSWPTTTVPTTTAHPAMPVQPPRPRTQAPNPSVPAATPSP